MLIGIAAIDMAEKDAKCSANPCSHILNNPTAVVIIHLPLVTRESSLINGVGVYPWRVLQSDSNSFPGLSLYPYSLDISYNLQKRASPLSTTLDRLLFEKSSESLNMREYENIYCTMKM